MAVAEEITGVPDFGMPSTDVFEAHLEYVEKFKKAVLLVAGAAVEKLMQTLAKEQEVLMGLKRFTKTEPFNTTAARQEVAVKLIEEGKYCW